jgi:hypothetical protein
MEEGSERATNAEKTRDFRRSKKAGYFEPAPEAKKMWKWPLFWSSNFTNFRKALKLVNEMSYLRLYDACFFRRLPLSTYILVPEDY